MFLISPKRSQYLSHSKKGHLDILHILGYAYQLLLVIWIQLKMTLELQKHKHYTVNDLLNSNLKFEYRCYFDIYQRCRFKKY